MDSSSSEYDDDFDLRECALGNHMVRISDCRNFTPFRVCPEKKRERCQTSKKKKEREGNVGGETKKGRNGKKNKGM